MTETKKYNNDWYVVKISEYDNEVPLVNPKKDYTMLCNMHTHNIVVAYGYDSEDNTWCQGHYFDDFYRALEFMYAPVE